MAINKKPMLVGTAEPIFFQVVIHQRTCEAVATTGLGNVVPGFDERAAQEWFFNGSGGFLGPLIETSR